MDIISGIIKVLEFLGITTPGEAGGWLVSVFVSGFMIWRMNIMDKKQEQFVEKISQVISNEEKQWRDLIKKTDYMTFDMLKSSTNSMTILSEKINTLQLILLQYKSGKKDE